jgi:hypothetical protein
MARTAVIPEALLKGRYPPEAVTTVISDWV